MFAGAKLYMVGRSKARTEAAAKDVIRKVKVESTMVHALHVDLASPQSVRDFAKEFKNSENSHTRGDKPSLMPTAVS